MRTNFMRIPKPCQIIIFKPKWKPHKKYPLKVGERVLFLGNIPNMTGHCAVVKFNGKVIWAVHPQDFLAPTEDELDEL